MSLSYQEIIECRYIGLFSISKKNRIKPPILSILILIYFVFLPPKILRKFQKFSGNPEIPKIQKISENSPKFQKIRRNFRKFAEISENSPKIPQKKVFSEALISYRYRIVSRKNPNIVSISYQVEKKLIALHCLQPGISYQRILRKLPSEKGWAYLR